MKDKKALKSSAKEKAEMPQEEDNGNRGPHGGGGFARKQKSSEKSRQCRVKAASPKENAPEERRRALATKILKEGGFG